MNRTPYEQAARDNETVFRAILRDLAKNRAERPMGCHIPENLDSKSSIDDILEKYAPRQGQFCITAFGRPTESSATISYKDVAFLSGGGASLEYAVDGDRVSYSKTLFTFRS